MIFYLIFIILLVAISIFLAYISMRDIYDFPEGGDVNSLFLVRNPKAFARETLEYLQKGIKKGNQILSIERLYKGKKSALAVFGPRKLLEPLRELDLVELEDYTKVSKKQVNAWEIKKTPPIAGRLNLSDDEQVWLQYVLQARDLGFKLQMRVVHVSPNQKKPNAGKVYTDFLERSITPLGKGIVSISSEKLLAILLPHQ